MNKKKIVFLLIGFWTVVFCLGGCAEQKDEKVVIASKPHSEQYILAEMLTELIEAKTDIQVEQKLGIGGGTSNIHPAVLNGEIDIYPEYTGTGWLFVLKQELINDPEELYTRTKTMYEDMFDMIWLDRYGFNNTFALAMPEEKAASLGIVTYSDLANHSEELSFGAEYDFFERDDGFPNLSNTYGLNFRDIKELDIGLKYAAVQAGEVDVINAFSTDGLLLEYGMRVLVDDLHYFPAYQAATVINDRTLEKYPELKKVLNSLSGMISDQEMAELNYLVEKEKRDAKNVAREFLFKKGLL